MFILFFSIRVKKLIYLKLPGQLTSEFDWKYFGFLNVSFLSINLDFILRVL